MVTCHGFIPENQRLVVRILIKHVAEAMPLYYDRPGGVDELIQLATPEAVKQLEHHLFYDGTFRLSLCGQYVVSCHPRCLLVRLDAHVAHHNHTVAQV